MPDNPLIVMHELSEFIWLPAADGKFGQKTKIRSQPSELLFCQM